MSRSRIAFRFAPLLLLALFLSPPAHVGAVGDTPVGNVLWILADSISACPAGDSVVAGYPCRLRIEIEYFHNFEEPKVGVPPESIYVTYSTVSGNAKANDEGTKVFAIDPTDVGGDTHIIFPSLSGVGTLRVYLKVSGTSEG